MTPHSSTLAWKIPRMEEPGRLQSMGSLRVGQDWASSLSLFSFMHWRRKWQPTPVFLPGESQGPGSLVGCRLWGSHRVRHDWSDLAAASLSLSFPSFFGYVLSILKKTFVYFRLHWVFAAACRLAEIAASRGYSAAAVRLLTGGFSCRRAWARQLGLTGFVFPQHVESSHTRDWTHVPSISRGNSYPLDHQGSSILTFGLNG